MNGMTFHGIYLAQVNFLQNYNGNVKSGSSSIEDPAPESVGWMGC